MFTQPRRSTLVLLAVFLVLIAIILHIANPDRVVFTQAPQTAKAEWIVPLPITHIGDLIEATLRITSEQRVVIDIQELPDAGDVWRLPDKYVNSGGVYGSTSVPEGQVEVISRSVTRHSEDNLQITDISYGLVYLEPIDLSIPVNDKQLPTDIPIFERYQLLTNTGEVVHRDDRIQVETADFSIAARVDENSQPIFTLFPVTPPESTSLRTKALGIGFVGLAVGLFVWHMILVMRAHARTREILRATGPDIEKLYDKYLETQNREIFIEAIRLYRLGTWGRPKLSSWITTTFILYSGVVLDPVREELVFLQILEEVSHEHAI